MKLSRPLSLSRRVAVPAAALVLAGLTATACAPSTSDNSAKEDEKSGKLRVWLFQEVDNKPKQRVVDDVVSAFEKKHDGVKVDVTYIPIDTRAQKIKAAFNDPKSAPDVIEYGNTDTAGYVEDGGLADISKEFGAWDESANTDSTAKNSVTVGGKVYGVPLFVGVRALYYRTDVFKDLGLEAAHQPEGTHRDREGDPRAEARPVRHRRSAAPTPTARCPSSGPTAANWPPRRARSAPTSTSRPSTAPTPRRASRRTPRSSPTTTARRPSAPQLGGNDSVAAFAAGKSGMAIGGDFNHAAIEAGSVKGKYAVVPLPGVKEGSIAPAFAGGNNLGVLKSSTHRTLAVDLMEQLAGKKTQAKLFDAMGFLPTFTDVRGGRRAEGAVRQALREDAGRRHQVRARLARLVGQIDSSLVLPTMFQQIISGKKDVDDAAAGGGEEDGRGVRQVTSVHHHPAGRAGAGPEAPAPAPPRAGPGGAAGQGSRTPWLYLAPALVVLGGLLVYPIYQLGLISFLEYTQAQVSGGEPTTFQGFGNYAELFARPPVLEVLLATVVFAAACVVVHPRGRAARSPCCSPGSGRCPGWR